MAFDLAAPQGNKKGRSRPEMNVTPLVDVVLVLLIIFMVLTAVLNEHFWVHVPEKDKDKDKQEEIQEPGSESDQPLVVTVNGRGRIQINRDEYPDDEFATRLRRMLVARGDRRVYFDAHDGVPFERAVEVMDLARGGGAAHVAVLTETLD